jgi:hypothetical protein
MAFCHGTASVSSQAPGEPLRVGRCGGAGDQPGPWQRAHRYLALRQFGRQRKEVTALTRRTQEPPQSTSTASNAFHAWFDLSSPPLTKLAGSHSFSKSFLADSRPRVAIACPACRTTAVGAAPDEAGQAENLRPRRLTTPAARHPNAESPCRPSWCNIHLASRISSRRPPLPNSDPTAGSRAVRAQTT